MKPFKFNQIGNKFKAQLTTLSGQGFHQIFDHIDQLNIKKGVDKMGLDRYIEQCAYMAAGSGVISGSGGMLTMLVGMPVDMVTPVNPIQDEPEGVQHVIGIADEIAIRKEQQFDDVPAQRLGRSRHRPRLRFKRS